MAAKTLNLKAQQPQVRVECVAKSPDVEDTFFVTYRRYDREQGRKHREAIQAMQKKGEADGEFEAIMREHIISVELKDADDNDVEYSDDVLKALFNSSPYFLALLDGTFIALDNVKAENDRLGNLNNLVATLLQANVAKSTKTH